MRDEPASRTRHSARLGPGETKVKIISPLLKHVVYPGLSRSGYLRRCARSSPVVITYHGILPHGYEFRDTTLDGHLTSAEEFVRQIRLIKANYDIISPEQFLTWCDSKLELPPRAVMLTCDDGLLNTLTDMLPIVQDLNVPFLFFVTGASLAQQSLMLWYEQLYLWLLRAGENFSLQVPWQPHAYVAQGRRRIHSLWLELIKKLSPLDANSRGQVLQNVRTQLGISENWESEYAQNEGFRRRFFMLNLLELRQLADAGMTIGAHTLSHPMLSQMTEERAFHEISQSQVQLERVLGKEIWALAYPFGNAEAVNAREPELARRAGFKCAFMNVQSGSDDRFGLPRVHVSAGMNLAEFEAHVSGFYHWMREKYFHMSPGVIA
jgi:peptidoglycan/xylan/chitin deacetylase (PgdA/CDA1 family)